MVAELHACPACGDSIPFGRLACPGCGTVLAAVARRVDASAPLGGHAPADNAASLSPPGAYIPPRAEAPTDNLPPMPAMAQPIPALAPLAPAGAAPAERPPAPILPRAWDPAAAAAGEGVAAPAAPSAATRTGRFALPHVDRARIEELADTVMLAGAFGLVLAFLAPWASVVIGSRGSGYFERWGLAGSGHLALFLLALGVLALAVVHNPIGRWLRTGVLGVALGSFVLGLAWPYVVGPLGAGPGALLAWISGLVMCIAGIMSLLVLRHAALPPDV